MTNGTIVFVGPTLTPAEVRQHVDAVCLPPVSQGDVYRVTLERPWAIGIVDGLFERAPAVWHKEILWALSQGIHVFGAASMGALRAAELDAFGMVGIGRIFESFRDGALTDDDEVAVRHAGPEAQFRPASEALVNVRATLDAALREGILAARTVHALTMTGKRLFYAERTYPRLLAEAAAAVSPAEARALEAWLPSGRVNQKRLDAIDMLRAMAERRARDTEPFRATFTFAHTDMWEQVGRAPAGGGSAGEMAAERLEPLLDEVRLAGDKRFEEVASRALARALGLREAERQGVGPTNAAADRLVQDEARLEQVRALFARDAASLVRDVLRLEGTYASLAARAGRKTEELAQLGPQQSADDTMSERDLLEWYFVRRLSQPVPSNLDAYAVRVGCPDRHALLQLLWREWWYVTISTASSTAS